VLAKIKHLRHVAHLKRKELRKVIEADTRERIDAKSLIKTTRRETWLARRHIYRLQSDVATLRVQLKNARKRYLRMLNRPVVVQQWRKSLQRRLVSEERKVQALARMLRHNAKEHNSHYLTAEHAWTRSRKAFLRLKAEKIRAEKEYRQSAMGRFHQKQHELNKLKKQYSRIMRKVAMYKAKRQMLRRIALLRGVRFERVLARLKAKAKRLHDIRLLEARRNHDMEIEIKKVEHKKWMLDQARKQWRQKVEFQQAEREKVNEKTKKALEMVQKYKSKVRKITREVRERNLREKRRISHMKDHLRKEKWLVAHLRAILAKQVRKVMMVRRREEVEALEARRWKAKHLHKLAVHRKLEREEEAEVLSKRSRIHGLLKALSHQHHVYNWARNKLAKVKREEEQRYTVFVRKAALARKLAMVHERARERELSKEAMRRSFLRLNKLQRKHAEYMRVLRQVQIKLRLQKQREAHQRRVTQQAKREWRKLERLQAKYRHEYRRDKARYSRALAAGRHLRRQVRMVRLKLTIILRRERKWEKTYQKRRNTQVQRWRHRIGRSKWTQMHLRKEVDALRRKYTHLEWSNRRHVLALKKLKLHLMKVVHGNHLIQLHLRQLERTIHKRRLILKRRGANLKATWRKQRTALRKLIKQKRAVLLDRARLLATLRVARKIRAQQMTLFRKEHEALIILGIKVKQQTKRIQHLKFLYSCGKLQTLARNGRRYSQLLRGEGQRLTKLVHELYTVENNVSRLGKILEKHVSSRRRVLNTAERYVKWAHHMIRDHKW